MKATTLPKSVVRRSRFIRGAILASLAILCAPWAGAQTWLYSYDSSGNTILRWLEAEVAPQILAQPQRQVVAPGEVVSFSVVVADASGVAFQWRFNDTAILGATQDSLLLRKVDFKDEGLYTVVIANSSGSVTSAPAALMIDSLGGGMPDSWQEAYFGSYLQNPAGDYDGDGVSNLDEFLEGTDPTDPTSFRPRLRIQTTTRGQVLVNPNLLSYALGQYVSLTAAPDAFSAFAGWSGDVTGSKTEIWILMNGHKSVTASFIESVPPPVFQSVSVQNGKVGLTWSSVPGHAYYLQYTKDLNHAAWINLGVTNFASDSTMTLYDSIGPDPQRFYRAGLVH